MKGLIIRLAIALCLGIILSYYLPVKINDGLIQALFTVLGIVFSIAMGLLVSFNLTAVLNDEFRKSIRRSIGSTKNWLLADFAISTIVFSIGLIYSDITWNIRGYFVIRCNILCISIILLSLIYEIFNFRLINKLRIDIEERLIKEKNRKKDTLK